MMTRGEALRTHAERSGIPVRSLEQVQQCISRCKRQKSDEAMARLMLNHGRMTEEARAWLLMQYPQ